MSEGGGADQTPAAATADGAGNNKPNKGGNDSRRHRGRRNRANKPAWKENNPPAHIQKEKFVGQSDDLKGFI
jgi:hypothetical protein